MAHIAPRVSTIPPQHYPPFAIIADDEVLAARSRVRLLITATTPAAVETIARRVHTAGSRAAFPFVSMNATDFPLEPRLLKNACSVLLEAASGGTLFVRGVDMMPVTVQAQFIGVLQELQSQRMPAAFVRLVSGTTVSLWDRVAGGTFSEPLFYRLNVMHLESERGTPS